MTKRKTWVDLESSLDEDWPPHQPITIADLVTEARAVDWDLVLGVTRADMTPATRMPAGCSNACWLTPGSRAAPACIEERPGCITMLKTLIIATLLLPTLAFGQRYQQLPQPRQPGQWCPVGWMASGSYCVPGSDKAPAAIPKNG